MITIRDVAKKAGISIAAVSYALNGKEGVNEETKKRVISIANELGYVPNSLAQGLHSKKTNIIGLIVPDITNTYTANLIKYLNIYARENDYFLLLGSTSGILEEEKKIIESFISKKVDALIIVPHNNGDDDFYKELIIGLQRRKIPFVFANMSFPGIKTDYVVPDLEEGEYLLTSYLLKNGFKEFVYIGGDKSHYYSYIKYQGFLKGLKEFGLSHKKQKYIECGVNYTFDEGYNRVKKYIQENSLPEVFICVSDLIAYGAIKALNEAGYTVPKDVSIVGFDDIELPFSSQIKLTTVKVAIEEIAKACINIIIDKDNEKIVKNYIIQTELIIGNSVKV